MIPDEQPQPVMSELLPCPFCGGSAETEQLDEKSLLLPLWWLAGCADADCIGLAHSPFERRGDAIKAWNTRASPEEKK